MIEQERLEILQKRGAVITGSHIVYTSDRHGPDYINKDMVSLHPRDLSALCKDIAEHFAASSIDVVVAPAVGAIAMAQWVGYHLAELTGCDVLAAYAEKAEQSVLDAEQDILVLTSYVEHPPKAGSEVYSSTISKVLHKGDSMVIKSNEFVVKRGYAPVITGKNVLVIEDVLTTGGSALGVIRAVREARGNVIGLGALCNRGGVSRKDMDVSDFFALVNVSMDSYPAEECGLCKQHVPINTDIGKGWEYVQKHGQP